MTHLPALEVLIERCEAAQGPDREIDAAIALIVGWTGGPGKAYWTDHNGRHRNRPPEWTASIDAALALAERLLPEWTVQVFQLRRNKGWGARVSSPRYDTYSSFEDDEHATDDGFTGQANGALALLVAILKALRSLTKLEG